MPLILDKPELNNLTVTRLVITDFNNSIERGVMEIKYKKILANGETHRRDVFRLTGKEEIKQAYADLNAIIDQGNPFEVASKIYLYSCLNQSTLE